MLLQQWLQKDHLDLRLEDYATKEELKLEIKNLKEDIEIMLGKHIGTFRKDYDELARRVKN